MEPGWEGKHQPQGVVSEKQAGAEKMAPSPCRPLGRLQGQVCAQTSQQWRSTVSKVIRKTCGQSSGMMSYIEVVLFASGRDQSLHYKAWSHLTVEHTLVFIDEGSNEGLSNTKIFSRTKASVLIFCETPCIHHQEPLSHQLPFFKGD
jgi:hypothetical protein